MAYTPNADDLARPVLSDPPITIPAEFRAIKQKIKDVNDAKRSLTDHTAKAWPAGDGELTASGATNVDLTKGNFFRYNLTADSTFTFTVPTLSNTQIPYFTLRLSDSGNFTVTWPNVNWELGVVPERTVDGIDVFVFYKPYSTATFWEGKLVLRDVQ